LNALTKVSLLFLTLIQVMACAQAEPLSITLVNPKTNAVMKCSARESSGARNGSLSGMVELCAKQLEARGFVRVDEKTAAQLVGK
jgi:hypothetical protein